jgi:hypothetical protein
MSQDKMSDGQRAYEARRAAKAGMTLERWLEQKERTRRAEEETARKAAAAEAPAPAKKPGFFARLLEKAQKPL